MSAIEKEVGQTNNDLNEIKSFRDKYSREIVENEPSESTKYSLNELEIAYNLLYVSCFVGFKLPATTN